MRIEFATSEDKLLFLKYAVPCGMTLVNRGDISMEHLDNLREKAASERVDDVDPEETFKIAVRMCYLTARKLGKEMIDSGVIRKYFWHDHEDAIKWRSEVFNDIRLDTCRVYPGRVEHVGDFVTVRTSMGNLEFRKDFIPDIRTGDIVVTHYDHVIERISLESARKLGFSP
jgi:hypothetical protein